MTRQMLLGAMMAAWSLAGCDMQDKCDPGKTCGLGLYEKRSELARAEAPSAANVPTLGSDNRAFAFALYGQAARAPGNVVLSPYSVSSALAMTYAGARGNTASELKQALHFTLEQPALHEAFNATHLALTSRGAGKRGAEGKPFKVEVNNALWAEDGYPVEAAFLDTLALNYGAPVNMAPFMAAPEQARTLINDKIAEQTHDLSQELLPPGSIHGLTRFVLTNTVFFDAAWQTQFFPNATANAAFTRLDGSTATAPMMRNTGSFQYDEGADWQAVGLPYEDSALSMIAVLPAAGKFAQVEAQLDGAWFDALQRKPELVKLGLPKFEFDAHFSLEAAMQALGVKDAFGDAADFSGLTNQPVKVDDVIHQGIIKVTEGGTLAAGATAVPVATKSSKPVATREVEFNRPFLFLIVDEPTGSILFLGRVVEL